MIEYVQLYETVFPAAALIIAICLVLASILEEEGQKIIPNSVVFGFIAVCGMATACIWWRVV